MKFLSTVAVILLISTLETTKSKKKVHNENTVYNELDACKQHYMYAYPPLPKTKECLDKELTIKIIELYRGFLNITQNLFAITREQANSFKDLVIEHEKLRKPPVPQCKRNLPKFAQCDFDKVTYILRTTNCSVGDKPAMRVMADEEEINGDKEDVGMFQSEDVGMFQSEETKDEDEDEDEDYKRKKREVSKRTKRSTEETRQYVRSGRNRRMTNVELKKGQIIRNEDNSITEIRDCYLKKSKSENEHLRMTKQCTATTTLTENRFPRYINEVLCDLSEAHKGCLTGEGLSVERKVELKFRIDSDGLGFERLGSWQEYPQIIRASCSCQVKTGSFFEDYI